MPTSAGQQEKIMTTFANVQTEMNNVAASLKHVNRLIEEMAKANESGIKVSATMLDWFYTAEKRLVDSREVLARVHKSHRETMHKAAYFM